MVKMKVLIPTYNLEQYVRQSLDSVLMQKVDFEYKIVIADDASTDATVKILEEYANKYPNIIEILKSDKNRGTLGNSNRLYDNLNCEYFCLLDGDDYWISEDVLQKKIDFLDGNKDYTMCAGNIYYLQGNSYTGTLIQEKYLGRSFGFKDYIEETMPFVHTSAIVLRNVIFNNGNLPEFINAVDTFEESGLRGEDFRFQLHLEKGKIYLFNEVHSAYRIHEKGVWQGASQTKHMLEWAIASNFQRKYWKDYEKIFEKRFVKKYIKLQEHLKEININEKYQLNEIETKLLCGLYQDICNAKINWNIEKSIQKNKNIFYKQKNGIQKIMDKVTNKIKA